MPAPAPYDRGRQIVDRDGNWLIVLCSLCRETYRTTSLHLTPWSHLQKHRINQGRAMTRRSRMRSLYRRKRRHW